MERLLTLTKENKIINRPSAGKNIYFTVSDDNTDDLFINNGLLTIESVNEIFKEMFKEQQNGLVNIASQNTTPLQTSPDKLTVEIKDSINRLNNIMKKTDDLQLSIELIKVSQLINLRIQKTQLTKSKKHLREKSRN